MWCARRVGAYLTRRGWTPRATALAVHWISMLWEQVLAVVPITLLLILLMAIFFGREATNPGELTFGLVFAIVGLTMFVDALRMAVMPLGEALGEEMPKRLNMAGVLAVAFVLGVLCTYAEPAIASLRPLARLVSRQRTPYLHLMLNDFQEGLVLAIAVGVGVAAVLGTLRFVHGWSLKPLILGTLAPAVGCAVYMHWGDTNLRPLIGLSWDTGGITTGPVTVPILLALGIGVMKTEKDKAKAKEMLAKSVTESSGQQPSLDGFGIVTLASILPVLAVEIMSIILSFMYTPEEIMSRPEVVEVEGEADRSPVREILFAIRAILPLNAALILLVIVVLRQPIPHLTVFVPSDPIADDKKEAAAAEAAEAEAEGRVHVAPSRGSGAASERGDSTTGPRNELSIFPPTPLGDDPSAESAAASGADKAEAGEHAPAIAPPAPVAVKHGNALTRGCAFFFPTGAWALIIGVFTAQIGQILFNLGLTYGFTSVSVEWRARAASRV
jgi:hypothetical protein